MIMFFFSFPAFFCERAGLRVRLRDAAGGPFVRLISSNDKVEMYNSGGHWLFP